MIKFKNTGNVDTRSGFGEGLLELGKENKNIVTLTTNQIASICKKNDWTSIRSLENRSASKGKNY